MGFLLVSGFLGIVFVRRLYVEFRDLLLVCTRSSWFPGNPGRPPSPPPSVADVFADLANIKPFTPSKKSPRKTKNPLEKLARRQEALFHKVKALAKVVHELDESFEALHEVATDQLHDVFKCVDQINQRAEADHRALLQTIVDSYGPMEVALSNRVRSSLATDLVAQETKFTAQMVDFKSAIIEEIGVLLDAKLPNSAVPPTSPESNFSSWMASIDKRLAQIRSAATPQDSPQHSPLFTNGDSGVVSSQNDSGFLGQVASDVQTPHTDQEHVRMASELGPSLVSTSRITPAHNSLVSANSPHASALGISTSIVMPSTSSNSNVHLNQDCIAPVHSVHNSSQSTPAQITPIVHPSSPQHGLSYDQLLAFYNSHAAQVGAGKSIVHTDPVAILAASSISLPTPPSSVENPAPISGTSGSSGQVIQQIYMPSSGKIPLPTFDPRTMHVESFLSELNTYMQRKRLSPEDKLGHLIEVFNGNKSQKLWWQRTKLRVSTWEEFEKHFRSFFAATWNKNLAKQKLYLKIQGINEDFASYAISTDLEYRLLHPDDSEKQAIEFIIRHAHESIRENLLTAENTLHSFDQLVAFGTELESNRKLKDKGVTDKSQSPHSDNSGNSVSKSGKPFVRGNAPRSKDEGKPQHKDQKSDSKPRVVCQLCEKPGHAATKCFKLNPDKKADDKPKQSGKSAKVNAVKSSTQSSETAAVSGNDEEAC